MFEKSSSSCEPESSCSASDAISSQLFFIFGVSGTYMAFPFTSNLSLALSSAFMWEDVGAGAAVIDLSSPLLRVIWGRMRLVRASLSVGAGFDGDMI
jgi:hypothetical protein